jgi:uncharacterized protein (TIGR03000 family)
MYSIVLMMALGNGVSTPANQDEALSFGRQVMHDSGHRLYRGCCGCHGCGGCHGCHGGGRGCHGCHGGRGCHGCHGGCYGGYSSCYGGYGGCYGGGYGGCYGGGYGGCYGGGYGGCYGGHGGGVIVAPAHQGKAKEEGDEEEAPKKKTTMSVAPATILVSLPADAKLTFDDAQTTSTSAERTFVTPNLQPDTEYHYTLKATIVRAGETLNTTRRIAVRAGEEARVSLEFPAASVARK